MANGGTADGAGSALELTERETEGDGEWTKLAPGITPDDYTPKPPMLTSALPADQPAPDQPLPALPPAVVEKLPVALDNKRQDIRVDDGEPGVCGLLNMGNTCYLNAALQCILVLPELMDFCLGDNLPKLLPNDSSCNSRDQTAPKNAGVSNVDDSGSEQKTQAISHGHITVRLSTMFRKFWSGQFSALLPKHLKTTIGLFNSQFAGGQQQDSQEFLEVLLSMLHEDLCHWHGRNDSVVSSCFQGRLRNQVTCLVCGHSSVKTDPFLHLSLPIPHSHQQQLVLCWCPLHHQSATRMVSKLLLVLPKVCSVRKVKEELCSVLNGALDPDSVLVALVKENHIDHVLADTVVVKRNSFSKQCAVYAFENRPEWCHIILSRMEQDCPPDKNLLGEKSVCPGQSSSAADTGHTFPANSSRTVVGQWHSCAICLEEMMDTDLLTHSDCGTVICHPCLQASQQHFSSTDGTTCPVCQASSTSPIFVPLTPENNENSEGADVSLVRLIQLTVILRHESSPGVWSLLGHPSIINVPVSGQISEYHTLASCLLPPGLYGRSWSLALTDAKGQFCSRCVFGSGCAGCRLLEPLQPFAPRPGDFLSVSFSSLPRSCVEAAGEVHLHPSLESLWPERTTLLDCLELFSQQERLGESERWFCERCSQKQPVVRQLMPSKIPPVLVIQLKRFLFHQGSASRVDTAVEFPRTLLGSAFPGATEPVANMHLVGCVCHTGTLSYGHYTAYSCHPVSKKWHYFNDESVSEGCPSAKDDDNIYILLYSQELGEETIERKNHSFLSEEEELQQVNLLLRVFKPKPPPLPPPEKLKRSSSSGNIASDSSSHALDRLELGQGAFPPVSKATTAAAKPPLKRSLSNPRLNDSVATQYGHSVLY